MIQEKINIDRKPVTVKVAPVIKITGLYKSFGENNDVLKGVDLAVQKGENLVVLGR